jgi:hypothetical protein
MPEYSLTAGDLIGAKMVLGNRRAIGGVGPASATATSTTPATARGSQSQFGSVLAGDGLQQLVLHRRMCHTLNIGDDTHGGVRGYTDLYGTLSEQCPFGDRVWDGLRADFSNYPYSNQWQMTGRRFLGWFLCPQHFSRANAGQAIVPGDSQWYPAVFSDVEGQLYMACLHIVVVRGPPWPVHRSRVEVVRLM